MNLLLDTWIPVRHQQIGVTQQISLETLLCEDEQWELALPRDDMELAALQLLICFAQVLLPPADRSEWIERIVKPLSPHDLQASHQNYQDWFQLNHPKYPFMQVKDVEAKSITPMDKLLAGLDTSTNSRFVNEPKLAKGLCFGCTAIALYNLANGAPNFGGGFKCGLRGGCPVSTFAQGDDLRSTIWLNVLSRESLERYLPEGLQQKQEPTWVDHIGGYGCTISAHTIGLLRGLLWQPGHIKLASPDNNGQCSCCGHHTDKLFTGFYKAKFNYAVEGNWEHPHSPQVLSDKKGKTEPSYVRFETTPAWTQLSRYVVKHDLSEEGKGQQAQKPALVIEQMKKYLREGINTLELLVGGYRNNQAAILERRHEVLILNQGWETHTSQVHELVEHGLKYKEKLCHALFIFSDDPKRKEKKFSASPKRIVRKGVNLVYKEKKKSYHALVKNGETQFYRRSEDLMMKSLANVDFNNTLPTFLKMDAKLKEICESVFMELTSPYQHDPELFRTLAIARRSLRKDMKEIRMPEPMKAAA